MPVNKRTKVTQQPLSQGSQANIEQSLSLKVTSSGRLAGQGMKVTGQNHVHSGAEEAPGLKGR